MHECAASDHVMRMLTCVKFYLYVRETNEHRLNMAFLGHRWTVRTKMRDDNIAIPACEIRALEAR